MPGIDGLELALQIRSVEALGHLPMVMLTSVGTHGRERELRESGIIAALTKPVRQPQLLATLTAALSGRRDARRPIAGPAPASPIAAPVRTLTARRRVLVAEDNPVNQRVAVRMLERLGLAADVAADGREAVNSFSRQAYAAILMDCQMPELDGFEATAHIKASEGIGRHTPIIAMTASAMRGDREKCLAAGMDDYVSKPVTIDGMRAVLERWLSLDAEPSGAERGRARA